MASTVANSKIMVQSKKTGRLPTARDSGIHTKAPIPLNSVGAEDSKSG
jgi:hypothetical protein